MATSTLTLPVNALSAARSSFSKSRQGGAERAVSPAPSTRSRNHNDQEAIEMDALGTPKASSIASTNAAEAPAWNMSAGWNDATTGPLLPTIQAYYHINFTVVSMLFASNFVGFMSAAVANVFMTDRFGFGKVILLGGLLQVVAYCLLSPALPFPVMCIAYALNGFGIALQDAQANGFVAALPNNASAKMGFLHAAYGAGAFVAPLVATQFAQLPRWSFHYLTSLVLAIANAVVLLVVFKLRSQDEILGIPSTHTDPDLPANASDQNKYKQIFGSRAVQLMAFFIWVYVGTEVTIGGWIVTFVIEERGGGPSAGYISRQVLITEALALTYLSNLSNAVVSSAVSLMLGRVVLLWVNEKVGERRVIYLYSVLAIGLELVIWLVPNIIGNGVAVSLIGLLLGCVAVIVPRWILTGSIGWIASFGQAGSAVFPFMTGALAQKHGVKVLQPMLVGMIAAMLVLWTLIPTVPKRRGD
ncbi:hypothetical protein FRC09_000122 [Ceratobasidium sp. 395]|nr:hypothetical protein FRC09_000122 [Ceratobasidium sp. 395]